MALEIGMKQFGTGMCQIMQEYLTILSETQDNTVRYNRSLLQ